MNIQAGFVIVTILFVSNFYPAFVTPQAAPPPASASVWGIANKPLIFSMIFNSSYDPTTRPGLQTGNVTLVTLNYRLNLLYAVSSKDEIFSLDLYVREMWNDPRLAYPSQLWPPEMGPLRLQSSKIWKPDTFFYNAISCNQQDELVTLMPNGDVKWSRHQICTFHTTFDLTNFPFDSQSLQLHRFSFSYNSNELQLVVAPSPLNCFSPDPIASGSFSNSLWNLNSATCENALFLFRDGQSAYTKVITTLSVSRQSQNYIVKEIMPMFVIVTLSTLTYWIDPNSAPARVGGTITLVLSIVTFNLVVSNDLPKINYSTLLDWYVWKCFLFVIFAVAEYASVNHILTNKQWPVQYAYLIDDFCRFSILPIWLFSNLLFWPILPNAALTAFVAFLDVFVFFINVYRIYWNYKKEVLGLALLWNLLGRLRDRCREKHGIELPMQYLPEPAPLMDDEKKILASMRTDRGI